MFTPEVEVALHMLYKRANGENDNFTLERIDRALDEIVRNPDSASPARHQVRSALANASKVIGHRRGIAPIASLDLVHEDSGERYHEPAQVEHGFAVVDLRQWIRTEPELTDAERQLLLDLVDGDEARAIADRYRIPLPRARERASRARRKARSLYSTA